MSLLCIAVKKARLIGSLGQCNTYVSLKLQNVKSTTVTVKGNNPSWEQDFIFETNRMDTGLVIEVWNKGVLWDKLIGCHWLPLLNIQYSNEEGDGKWISLDAELVMKDGEVFGTKNPTGSTILVDARFELPYDLQDAEAMELQRKLEVLNTIMDQEIVTLKEQARRATLSMHSGMSEDSDYTSDVNYPIGQYANSSASQYRRHVGLLSDRSADDGLQNSYERDYAYDAPNSVEEYNDGRRSDTESEPLYYNSRPRNHANYSYSPPRYSSTNFSRQSTQDYMTEELDRDYLYEDDTSSRLDRRPPSRRPSASEYRVSGRRPSLERQTSFDHEHAVEDYADYASTYPRYAHRDADYYYNERGEDGYYDERPVYDQRWPLQKGDSIDSRGVPEQLPLQHQQQQRDVRDRRWTQERGSDLEEDDDEEDMQPSVPVRRDRPPLQPPPSSSKLLPINRSGGIGAVSTSTLVPATRSSSSQETSDYRDSFETDFPGGEALPQPPQPPQPPPVTIINAGRRDPISLIGVPDVITSPSLIDKSVDSIVIPTPIVLDMDIPKPTPRIRWLTAFNKVCAQLNDL